MGRRANPNSSISRKMPVLMPSSHVTALVNGGRLNVIGSPVRRTDSPLVQFYSHPGCPMSRVFCETWDFATQPLTAPEPAQPAGCDDLHGRQPAPRKKHY